MLRAAPEHTYWPKPFNGHLFHTGAAIIGLASQGLNTAERASELVQFEVERKLVPGDITIGGEHYKSLRRSNSQSADLERKFPILPQRFSQQRQ
jgi:hypothetical protein